MKTYIYIYIYIYICITISLYKVNTSFIINNNLVIINELNIYLRLQLTNDNNFYN